MDYIKRNKKNLIILFLVGLLTYGIRIFTYNISIDTEALINNPEGQLDAWIGLGRWGLVGVKRIFNLIPINIFLSNILTFIFFYISIIIWGINIEKITKKSNKYLLVIFGSILFTSPIIAEQFYFTLQSVEIALAFLAMSLAIFFQTNGLEKGKILYFIPEIILLVYAFSCYQAFIVLYITICIFEFITKYEDKCDWKLVFKYIVIFTITFVLNLIINKILLNTMDIEESSYLSQQILWGKESTAKVFLTMMIYIGTILFGFGVQENLGFLIGFILLTIYFIKKKKIKNNKMFYLIYIFLFITPFITTLFKGNVELVRARFSLVFLNAFVMSYLITNTENKKMKKVLKICIIYVIFVQIVSTTFLFYADYKRYNEDVEISEDIHEKIEMMDSNKPIIFVGEYRNKNILRGETIGKSFFEWDATEEEGINKRAIEFMKTQKFDYNYADNEDIKQARNEAENMPEYPEEGSIVEKENYIIVNFGNKKKKNILSYKFGF